MEALDQPAIADPPKHWATYIAECFWPGVTASACDEAAARAGATAEELSRAGEPVRFLGSMLVPEDEVVFFQFAGTSEAVRRASEAAGLPYERIVESRLGMEVGGAEG